jgi:hypothetical protein
MHQVELSRRGLDTDHVVSLSIPLAFQDVLLISVFVGLLVVLLCLFSGERKISTIGKARAEPRTAL